MKSLKKIISVFSIVFTFCVLLTGCSNVYQEYNQTLPYNNVYEKISLKDLAKVLTAEESSSEKEISYVIYVTSGVTANNTMVKTFDEQAKQYGVSKIYYLDSSDYTEESKTRKEVEDTLGIKDASVSPAMFMFVDGKCVIDWTKSSVQKKYDSSYTKLAYDIFFENENLK